MDADTIAVVSALLLVPVAGFLGHLLGQRQMAARWRRHDRFKKETAVRGTRMRRIRVRRRDGTAAD